MGRENVKELKNMESYSTWVNFEITKNNDRSSYLVNRELLLQCVRVSYTGKTMFKNELKFWLIFLTISGKKISLMRNWVCAVIWIIFETRSCWVARGGLTLAISLSPPPGMQESQTLYHYTWLTSYTTVIFEYGF